MSEAKKQKTDDDAQALPELNEDMRLAVADLMSQEGLAQPEAENIVRHSAKALADVSMNKAVFALREWENKLKKMEAAAAEGWLDNPQWKAFRSIIGRHIGLTALSKSGLDSPWAIHSTAELLKLEAEMIELAKRESDDHPISPDLVKAVTDSKPTMADEQKLATVACSSGRRCVMVTEGTAGAGKSFTLNAIREIYEKIPGRTPDEEMGYDIIGTALSWTATKVLEASAGLSGGKAIEGLTRAMDLAHEKGDDFFKRRTVLIVDEAGLVGIAHMHKMLWHAANSKHPVRVILTGDSLQLNPVMAGNALEAIVDEIGSSRLDTIRRQKQDSHRRAVKHFCYGRAENGLWNYWQQEAIHFCTDNESRREKVMRDYVRYVVANPQKAALILALENAEVKTLNQEIRKRLKQVGRLQGKEYPIKVTDGKEPFTAFFTVGDQIVLRKNDTKHPIFKSKFAKSHEGAAAAHDRGLSQQRDSKKNFLGKGFSKMKALNDARNKPDDEQDRCGIFNRMAGLILDIKEHPDLDKKGHYILRILFNEGGETEIDTSVYRDKKHDAVPLNHNFATTIYASQGQTVERVLMIDSPYMNRRLAYVGASRHTELCDIYLDCTELRERMDKDRQFRSEGVKKALESAQKQAAEAPDAASADGAAKRIDRLKQELSEWEPKYAHELKPSDYLRMAAFTWNKDSQNPTPRMAQKHMNERREKVKKEGDSAWSPEKHPDDNPDDNHPTGKPEDDPDLRHPEPPAFDELSGAHADSIESKPDEELDLFAMLAKVKGGPGAQAEPTAAAADTAPKKQKRASQESRDLPAWTSEPLVAGALASLKGQLWQTNRFGYPRLFSVDPNKGYPTSRWAFDGALKAGDGDVPVLSNSEHYRDAPWMMVQDTRQALISWAFYRDKHGTDSSKVPNIAVAYPAADLAALEQWFQPGSRVIYCAWSQKDPATLEKAQSLVERLGELGHKAVLYPKPPTPAPASGTRP